MYANSCKMFKAALVLQERYTEEGVITFCLEPDKSLSSR